MLAEVLFVFGLGVLAIAYSFRRSTLGLLAISLIGLSYWSGWTHRFTERDLSLVDSVSLQMPIVAAISFLPLAYRCRSQKLFGMSAIAICSSLLSNLGATLTKGSILPALLLILPAALLWAYDDTIWTVGQQRKLFQSIARRFAVVYLAGLFYWFSFYWTWIDYGWYSRIVEWRSLLSVGIFVAITIAQWIYLLIQAREWKSTMIGLMIVVSSIVQSWHLRIAPIPVFAPIVFNAMLGILAIVTVRDSLRTGERRAFWFGVILLIVQVLSRLLEYELSPAARAIVFGLLGGSAIASGLWFEFRIRRLLPAIAFQRVRPSSTS
ncbi:hypothetical protein [Leptolyngbya sp. NIES-2104]|uniref:hypothetical protein n=1 Tax=Leptolyngbya sp. NIES-2104 TaxID=1552121 RepID=UPI0006EC9FD9|nr:hypothetical protein [Leptolyngbya sp. NIES-2104]GAP95203.1 hypothetical protein NIES2104_17230 [Leptolyngbya sp. NIES-2104]